MPRSSSKKTSRPEAFHCKKCGATFPKGTRLVDRTRHKAVCGGTFKPVALANLPSSKEQFTAKGFKRGKK